MIRVVQSNPVGITCISISSMVGEYWMKDFWRPFAWWASSILLVRACELVSMPLNGSHILLRGLLS